MTIEDSVALTKKVILTSSKPITKEDFIDKIKEIAKNILLYLKDSGCKKLGHIKLITTTDGEDYLQLSVFDMDEEPVIKGVLKKAFEKVKLTLNIIEFGISKEDIDSRISEEIKNVEKYFSSL